jgi:glycerate kinase
VVRRVRGDGEDAIAPGAGVSIRRAADHGGLGAGSIRIRSVKILLAPDSFKESLTARAAALAMERGVKRANPDAETVVLPIADGGEGTMETLVFATGGQLHWTSVTGPLGSQVPARYGTLGDGITGVVEAAQASGLHLVPPEERNPLVTTTRGTGELIRHALDAGAGALQALGMRLVDQTGASIGPGGSSLSRLAGIDAATLDPRLRAADLRVACDVTNPLCGPNGASAIFGPQKGATPEMVAVLDANLRRFAEVLRRDVGVDVLEAPGSGAAGGLGAALLACGGRLVPGIQLVLDAVDFDAKVQGATAVLTGEGRIDAQTASGKVVAGLAERASRAGVPVIAFAGSVEPGFEALYERGLLSAHAILSRPASMAEAIAGAEANLEAAVFAVVRLLAHKPPAPKPPPPEPPPPPPPAPAKVEPAKHSRRGRRSR